MVKYKPVSVSKGSFAFCRYSIAAMLWLSFFFMSQSLLAFVFVVFLLSAVFKVRHAPMILLHKHTFGRFWKSEDVMLNEHAIAFAHLIGLFFSGVCLALVCFVDNASIWFVVFAFAVLKSVSALGFCPAARLYECTLNGNCCVNQKTR